MIKQDETYDFCKGLISENRKLLKNVSKSDLHNHATRGGCIYDFFEVAPELPANGFKDVEDMQHWYERNIKWIFRGKDGFIQRIESSFAQAVRDGIKVLALSFGVNDRALFNNQFSEYISVIKESCERVAPYIIFLPELSFSREDNPLDYISIIDEIFDNHFFVAIDLVGDESIPIVKYKQLFRKAKAAGLILKAHVGEFGNAELIRSTVELLGLDEVNHGGTAATSPEIMRWLAINDIRLNMCPTSNIILNRFKSYSEHPIAMLYRNGVKVTINSDDMLIFNQGVSDEYLNLYKCGILTPEELNEIRMFGLQL